MASQAGVRADVRVDAFGDILGFIRVAGAAVDGGGMFRMGIALDVGVAARAWQSPVNAGLLHRAVDINAMAGLVLQVVLAMAGQALGVALRGNNGDGESENEHGR